MGLQPNPEKGVLLQTDQWVGPCVVLEQLSDVVYRVKMCARGQLTQHGTTHTDESSNSNRQWGVGACDPTGSQAAAASPSLSGLCCRLRTGDILVGAM